MQFEQDVFTKQGFPGDNKVKIWQNHFNPAQPQAAYHVREVLATLRITCSPSFCYCITTQTLNIALYM